MNPVDAIVHMKFDTTPGLTKPYYFITNKVKTLKDHLSVPGLTYKQATMVKDTMKAASVTVIDHTS